MLVIKIAGDGAVDAVQDHAPKRPSIASVAVVLFVGLACCVAAAEFSNVEAKSNMPSVMEAKSNMPSVISVAQRSAASVTPAWWYPTPPEVARGALVRRRLEDGMPADYTDPMDGDDGSGGRGRGDDGSGGDERPRGWDTDTGYDAEGARARYGSGGGDDERERGDGGGYDAEGAARRYADIENTRERGDGGGDGTRERAPEVPGCTDDTADNFNRAANVDDGSCKYTDTRRAGPAEEEEEDPCLDWCEEVDAQKEVKAAAYAAFKSFPSKKSACPDRKDRQCKTTWLANKTAAKQTKDDAAAAFKAFLAQGEGCTCYASKSVNAEPSFLGQNGVPLFAVGAAIGGFMVGMVGVLAAVKLSATTKQGVVADLELTEQDEGGRVADQEHTQQRVMHDELVSDWNASKVPGAKYLKPPPQRGGHTSTFGEAQQATEQA